LQLFFHIFLIPLFSPRKLTQTVTLQNSIFVVSISTVGRNTNYSETLEFSRSFQANSIKYCYLLHHFYFVKSQSSHRSTLTKC
jgi:hypothetical protein